MKKGSIGPKCRAKWPSGYYWYGDRVAPCWTRPYSLFAVYVVEILGLPFPTTITESDCGAGQWYYVPSEGAVAWKGNFDNGLVSGVWFLKQATSNDQDTFNTFALTIDDGILNPRVIYDSGTHLVSGLWGYAFPRDPDVYNRLPGVTPWAFATSLTMRNMTYAEVRAWGADPNDTAPRTWSGSGSP